MKSRILLVLATAVFAVVAPAKGAFDIYIKTANPDLPGEVTVAPSGGVCPVNCGPGSWQLFSFSWGVNNPVSIMPGGGGGGAGQPSFSDLNLLKKLDRASVEALLMAAQGTHFGTVTVSFVETGTGGPPFLLYEIKMEEVYFSSVQHSGSAGGDDRPTESVSFAYGKITWKYYPRPVGTPPIVHFWDLRKNTGG